MSHSYDVIMPLSKQITRDYEVFIPVSNGIKIIKMEQKMRELKSKIKWFLFYGTQCMFTFTVQTSLILSTVCHSQDKLTTRIMLPQQCAVKKTK